MTSGRVMIVEDESLVAEDLNSILEHSGFDVVGVADSYVSAEQLADSCRPDLALLDIRLKGDRDGIDLAHELRRRNIGFVYLTSHSDDGTLARAEATEPLGYVLKPFGAREMLPVLKMALYRHAAELRLRNIESWLRTVLHSIGDAVVVTDREARVTYMNPVAEALIGRRSRHAIGSKLVEVMPIVDLQTGQRIDCVATSAMEQGVVVFMAPDSELLRADAMRLPIEDSAAPIRDADGVVTGAVVVLRDGTQRKRVEQSRLEAERRMRDAERLESVGVVASGLAHDLSNVLTSILGNVALCLEKEGGTPRTPLTEIEAQAKVAAQMCKRILAGASATTPEVEAIELASIVYESISTERALANGSIEFAANLERPNLTVLADPLQLRQVLQNLLRNANEAIGEGGGGITVRAGAVELPSALLGERSAARRLPNGPYVWLEISDDGPGIPDEVKARILAPFFTTKSTGRGLGLATVQGIVRRHGAAMDVESQVGVGTVFRLFWPAAPESSDHPKPKSPVGKVLLIDDDDAVRQATAGLLRSRGWTCHDASAPEPALASLRDGLVVDAVILDLQLETRSGGDVLVELRTIRPDMPVLVISGTYDPDMSLLEAEGVHFLGKPFLADALVASLQRLIGKQK